MYAAHRNLPTQDSPSWAWNLTPLLVAAVLSSILLPLGTSQADATAAEAARAEAPVVAQWLVPSPQPGEGEPELVAADLPQSY